MMNRRHFLLAATGGAAAIFGAQLGGAGRLLSSTAMAKGTFEITKTDAEWRAILTEAQFQVLRKEATERPFTSPLNNEKRAGLFHCAGCDLPLYSSETKYESGTGWPSFWDALPNAVGYKEDKKLWMTRTEIHCRRCGGHQGHVFNDGPQPTGKRHCINGVALSFKPGLPGALAG